MADTTKLISLANLTSYDELIKTYIKNADDVVNAKSIKTVLLDGDNIKFYKKENATKEDTADYTVAISSSDVTALKTRVGMSSTLNAYQSKENVTDIMNVLTADGTTTGSVAKALADAKSYTDTEIGKLDTSADIALATATDGVVTIKAVKETDGVIAASTDTTLDVTLKKVATTGAAEDVSIADTEGKITATTVEGALEEIVAKADTNKASIDTLNGAVTADGSVLKMVHDNAKNAVYTAATETAAEVTIAQAIVNAEANAKSASAVTVEKQATAETGYASTYVVKQNGTQVGDKINIAKDWLLKSVTIKTCTEKDKPEEGYVVGDRYFDFEFNTKDASETTTHVYLKVEELCDSYTSGSQATDAVVVVVDNDKNQISATVTDGTIARAKIDSTFESDIAKMETALQKAADGTYTTVSSRIDSEAKDATYTAASGETAKVTIGGAISALETKVGTETVANQIKTAVEALDATVTQDSSDTNPVSISITETDGKLTAASASVVIAATTDISALFDTKAQA